MALALDRLFADGMMLQRGKAVRVWGTAEPGQTVELEIQGRRASTVADGAGAWGCGLAPLAASEGEALVVRSGDERLALADVAVGEVYVAGGQSNMEFWMRYDRDAGSVRPTCANPRIRLYDAPKCSYPGQTGDFDYSQVGVWRKAAPEDLDRFPAVGYWFARRLEAGLGVPVGIVGCNYGGTTSGAWMRAEHAREVVPEQAAAFEAKLAGHGYDELLAAGALNPGKNDKGCAPWPAFNEFLLSGTPTAEEAAAFMREQAGLGGPADVGGLDVAGGCGASDGQADPALLTPTKEAPSALFEHMVAPIAGFAVRGVLWYQGESDDELDGAQWRHADALRAVMADWRDAWGEPGLPFLVVQLPGFGSWMGMGANDYATIRACQQRVTDEDRNAWLCSIGDMGDERDIHPKAKGPVGERLALLALRHLHGRDILADAPRVASVTREGASVRISFACAGDGLDVEGDPVAALEVLVAGEAVGFSAHASGESLVIDLDETPSGSATIRLAQANWFRINLYNGAHVPALPFEAAC